MSAGTRGPLQDVVAVQVVCVASIRRVVGGPAPLAEQRNTSEYRNRRDSRCASVGDNHWIVSKETVVDPVGGVSRGRRRCCASAGRDGCLQGFTTRRRPGPVACGSAATLPCRSTEESVFNCSACERVSLRDLGVDRRPFRKTASPSSRMATASLRLQKALRHPRSLTRPRTLT